MLFVCSYFNDQVLSSLSASFILDGDIFELPEKRQRLLSTDTTGSQKEVLLKKKQT